MTMVIDGTNGLTFPAGSSQLQAGNYQSMVNRIINGRMEIDQRALGTWTNTTSDTYTLDRWQFGSSQASKFTAQQSSTAPTGFINSMLITSSSAYTVGASETFNLIQRIEGLNCTDLAWGSASAQTVTLSFWVRSSLTGTFGGALTNSAFNRSYPYSYTISSANTWEQKSITIAGDTSGTWLTTNGAGVVVRFSLGTGSSLSGTAGAWSGSGLISATGATSVVGTNGATFYITGVDLRVGSYTVVPQDFRAYGTELALCQRYLPAFISTSTNDTIPGSFFGASTTAASGAYVFMVRARVRPTGITISAGSHFTLTRPSTGSVTATGINFAIAGTDAAQLEFTTASGLVADQSYFARSNSASAYILFTGCEL